MLKRVYATGIRKIVQKETAHAFPTGTFELLLHIKIYSPMHTNLYVQKVYIVSWKHSRARKLPKVPEGTTEVENGNGGKDFREGIQKEAEKERKRTHYYAG